MKDFSQTIKEALSKGEIDNLIKILNADPFLEYKVSNLPFNITKEAFYTRHGRENSLEHIFRHAIMTGLEIPFAGILEPKTKTFLTFFCGEGIDEGYCDWEKGTLLENAYDFAKDKKCLVSLGHTHPVIIDPGIVVRPYGAICSKIFYSEQTLDKENPVMKHILEKKTYENFGGDYCEMLARKQLNSKISDMFWILSPNINHVGLFRVQPKGIVTYHPWKTMD